MAIVLGLDAVLMRGTAGSKGTTEVKNVKDLTLNLESGEADVTTRATGFQSHYGRIGTVIELLRDLHDMTFQSHFGGDWNDCPV